MPGQRGRRGVDIAIGEIIGTPPIVKQHFGDKLYDAVIPRNVRLAEAPSYGMPALVYDKQSRGALAYLALAGELVRRQRNAARRETA